MKAHSVWVNTEWRFDKEDRRRISGLLNNNEQSVRDIERAVGLFKAARDGITDSDQSPTQVKCDLEDIRDAIATLSRLELERGTAWALFAGESADELPRIMSLQHALEDGRLEYAAAAAAENFSPPKGKPPNPHVGNRKTTIFQAALLASKRVGIEPSREGKFAELIEAIYKAIGASGSESDIRDHLKALRDNDWQ